MNNGFKVSLKANERIFINGAVVRVDRKTSLEFLNDVDFLLENHVMQAADADTPLKQLYFVLQIILMSPNDADSARDLFAGNMKALLQTFTNPELIDQLKTVETLVGENKIFEALKTIRGLYALEAEAMKAGKAEMPIAAEPDEQPRLAVG